MSMLHLVMPMGGRGSRFQNQAQDFPKPMIRLHGKPFFYWATQSIRSHVDLSGLTFVVLREHIDNYHIDEEILAYFPEAHLCVIPEVLNGAVLTCMEGSKMVPAGTPVLFNDCDHFFRSTAFNCFCTKGRVNDLDGALLTFRSSEPRYSFLQYDAEGFVRRTVEKQAISEDAICGAYYFKDTATFLLAAQEYLKVCGYAEYFMSGVYNTMADQGQKIKGFATDFHIPFGVPEEYRFALKAKEFETA
ncbi:dolichyl-phosphate mannose synthase [Ruminococcaceae bacterium OttesenSCG-928-I18]|nr:dolichyl-phosphate mannose synthase [Ruminococcaceae bacterium OttesenSCG-928-I18]